MTWVKICGLTRAEDALYATEQGADMLGFIMSSGSKRYAEPEAVRKIIRKIEITFGPRAPMCIGVFVAGTMQANIEISELCIISGVEAAQIVNLEHPGLLTSLGIPAYPTIRPQSSAQALVDAEEFEQRHLPPRLPTLQLDAFHPELYGGSGTIASLEVMQTLKERARRLMLSGGLTPENVGEFTEKVQPWAVDVASGTEASPGIKDHAKVRDFIQAVK